MDYFDQRIDRADSPTAAPRTVRVTKAKNRTFIKTNCDTVGSVSFVRSRGRYGASWPVRALGLMPPAPLNEGVDVFGLGGSLLQRFAQDELLNTAVDTLVSAGRVLTLQDGGLALRTPGWLDSETQDALSDALRIAASRIESLTAGSANLHVGPARLARPYTIAALASGLGFGVALGFAEPSLTPLRLFGISAMFVAAFALAATFVVGAHLRKHPLGGVVASTAAGLALAVAVSLGGLLCVLGNTYAGEMLLPATRFHARGNIGVSRGRHVHCWFYPDDPSVLQVAEGESSDSLPVPCRAVHFHRDSSDRSYAIEINPGLLGAPFVQAIRADDGN